MIKVSVMYPFQAGAEFDHEYYRLTHMPLVKSRLGAGCTHYAVDIGLGGGEPGIPPTYIAMCHIYSDTLEAFQAGMAEHGAEIKGDIANFTGIVPVIQVSEVVV
jgi:uncharacterized protein (TIGR02118 family)